MQVKLTDGEREERFGLPERFQEAILKLKTASSNVVLERSWKEQGVRFGDFSEIGREVTEELEAAYDEERLRKLTESAASSDAEAKRTAVQRKSYRVTLEMMHEEDWQNAMRILNKWILLKRIFQYSKKRSMTRKHRSEGLLSFIWA